MLYAGGITEKKDRPRATPRLDEFAELLSEGVSVAEAAVRMGLDPEAGKPMLSRLRKRLGWQAR